MQDSSHKMRQDIADLKSELDGKVDEYNQMAELFQGIKSEYERIDQGKLKDKKEQARELGNAIEENKKLKI